MQDRIDNKNRIIKFIMKFFISLAIFLFFPLMMISEHVEKDKRYVINVYAENCYIALSSCVQDNSLELPEKGTYYMTGECYNYDYYLAYAGDIFEQDTVIFGNAQDKINGYWAIRIDNGVITESWFSNYKLNKKQLCPYSIKEQKKQMHLFDDISKTHMIGYYSVD